MKVHTNLFQEIVSLENLFLSWQEFRRGKRGKYDVKQFERKLEDNLFELHQKLVNRTYRHGKYTPFTITDPKVRRIHKAGVRDRIVHHAVYRVLYQLFDPTFIFDSYSCRVGKGTHAAVNRLEVFVRKVSKNYTGPCFALKCDVRRFFDSVDHEILLGQISKRVGDIDTQWLIKEIVESFGVPYERERERESWHSARQSYEPALCQYLFARTRPICETSVKGAVLPAVL